MAKASAWAADSCGQSEQVTNSSLPPGRSMDQNLKVAAEIGYLGAPPGTLIDLRESHSIPPSQLVVLATGSQGEPTSVLSRMAMGDHPNVRIIEEDTVIFSAGPIPGNEETVARAIDNLYRRGAKVIYRAINEGVHVSGHSSQDELTQYLVQGAAQYNMEPGEFIKVLDQNGQIPGMIGEIARGKALAVVLSKAKVTDSNGADVDLSTFTAGVLEDDENFVEADAGGHEGHDHEGHDH